MFRRQPIVKAQHIHGSGTRQFVGNASGIMKAACIVTAAMTIENHKLPHMAALHTDPFRRNLPHLKRLIIQLSMLQQGADILLGRPDSLKVITLHKGMHSFNGFHQPLIGFFTYRHSLSPSRSICETFNSCTSIRICSCY